MITLLAALPFAVVVSRSVRCAWPAGQPFCDLTSAVSAAIPPLPAALLHVELAGASVAGAGVALLDPRVLDYGPASAVAPDATRRQALTVAAKSDALLLPPGSRLVAVVEDAAALPTDAEVELALRIEAAEPSASSLPAAAALARAALLAALAAQGVPAAELAALEADDDRPAARVFGSFVAADAPQQGSLVKAAERSAHHIHHLLRGERAAAASFLRNVDSHARAAAREGLPSHPIHLVLDNVRSAYNVGSIFRTADTARVAEVVTCGFTPRPPHPKLEKTAFAALESVATRHFDSTLSAVAALRAEGVAVWCMETTEGALNYAAATTEFPARGVALVLGNEETGVDTRVIEAADAVVEIPTFGFKNSLNIAAACPVVVFEVLRQWGALEAEPGGRREEDL